MLFSAFALTKRILSPDGEIVKYGSILCGSIRTAMQNAEIFSNLEKFDISSFLFYGIMYLVMLKWETVIQKEKNRP